MITDPPIIRSREARLEWRLDAARAICREREQELLEIKGPCRVERCCLHRAHRGPCWIKDVA